MNQKSPDRNTILSIVIPCYNEEEVLPETVMRLTKLLSEMVSEKLISQDSCVWLVDDGSKDLTWTLIETYCTENKYFKGIKLARNRGHQNALLAGLETATGDLLISIDADLQDDLAVIRKMVIEFHNGKDIVYGVRKSRSSDTFFKRVTAEGYYHILQKMGVNIVFNHADYRAMSRRAIEALKRYEEVNVFLRGIIPTIGFPSSTVEYDRTERFAGESKYPLRKMIALALDGITSFSAVPLRLIAGLGFAIFLASMALSAWALYVKLFGSSVVPGWTSSVLPMYALGGIQLLSVGVVGEYVAKMYMETKRRPKYILEQIVGQAKNHES